MFVHRHSVSHELRVCRASATFVFYTRDDRQGRPEDLKMEGMARKTAGGREIEVNPWCETTS